jgi:copper chaperone
MTTFDVPDMSCGHCTAAITKAISALDPGAKVDCDLAARIVSVDSVLTGPALVKAIKSAGYDAVPQR